MDAVVKTDSGRRSACQPSSIRKTPSEMSFDEVLPRQLEAINERFKSRVDKNQPSAQPGRKPRASPRSAGWRTWCRCCSPNPL